MHWDSMMKKSIHYYLFILFIILLVFQVSGQIDFHSTTNLNLKSGKLFKTSAVSSPISISNNTDLISQATANGWDLGGTRDGSASKPFLISGLSITSTLTTGFSVQDTTLYFEFQNNYISDTLQCIVLINVSNGNLDSNILADSNGQGISVTSSDHIIISGNTFQNMPYGDSLLVKGSQFITITNNTFQNVYRVIRLTLPLNNFSLIDNNQIYSKNNDGLSVLGYNNTISNNFLNGTSGYGIYLSGVNNTIINNEVRSFYTGIFVSSYSSMNNRFINNDIYNTSYGMASYGSNNTMIGNNITNTRASGIIGSYGDYYENNIVNNTPGTGITCQYSCFLIDNVIKNNIQGGIEITGSQATVINNTVSNNGNGIRLLSSSNSIVKDNYLSDDSLFILSAPNSTIVNNIVSNGSLTLTGVQSQDFNQQEVTKNIVNGLPLVYIKNNEYNNIPTRFENLIIFNSSNIVLHDLVINNTNNFNKNINSYPLTIAGSTDIQIESSYFIKNTVGITLINNSGINLLNNTFQSNYIGIKDSYSTFITITNSFFLNSIFNGSDTYGAIRLYKDSNCKIFSNSFYNNDAPAIWSSYAQNNIIAENTITGTKIREGMFLSFDYNSTIITNTIVNNNDGIDISYSSFSNIINNVVVNNSNIGIYSQFNANLSYYGNTIEHMLYFDLTYNTTVMLNNFIGSAPLAYDSYGGNTFINNFWADNSNLTDTNGDNIADTAYIFVSYMPNVNDSAPLVNYYNNSVPELLNPTSGTIVNQTVEIQWKKSENLLNNSIHYTIFYSMDSGKNWLVLVSNLDKTSYLWDTKEFPNGSTYLLKILAYDSYRISSSSDSGLTFEVQNVAHEVTKPIITTPIVTSVVSGSITINWLTSKDTWNSSEPITYVLYYSADGGNHWTILTGPMTTTSYSWDTNTVVDGSYLLKVVASNSQGLSAEYVMNGIFAIQNKESSGTSITTSSTTTSTKTSASGKNSPGFSEVSVISLILVLIYRKRRKQ